MTRFTLTDRRLRSLVSAEGRQEIWDSEVPGFGVRTTERKEVRFFLRYPRPGALTGARRTYARMVIGTYPQVSLSEARSLAREARRRVELGEDPAAERKENLEALSFRQLAERYLELYAKRNKRSWREDERILEVEILPALGALRASAIRRRDVLAVLDPVVARGAPIMANRVLAVVRRVFSWALERDLVEANPCSGIRPPGKERRRERVLSPAEIKALWQGLDQELPVTAAAFRLLLLTAQRSQDVRLMRWEEIQADLWTIPAARYKTGRTQVVPLVPQVLSLLHPLKVRGAPWVLRSTWGKHRGRPLHKDALAQAARRISRTVGFQWRPHDLRRTAATRMVELGIEVHHVERVLGHARHGAIAHYDHHTYLPEKRRALLAWARRVDQILADQQDSEQALPFRAEVRGE